MAHVDMYIFNNHLTGKFTQEFIHLMNENPQHD